MPDVTVKTATGETINLKKAYQNKTVLLHFWATWCGPCIKELPELDKFYPERDKDVEVISFVIRENPKNLPAIGKKLSFPVVDFDQVESVFQGVNIIPYNIIYKDGKIQDPTFIYKNGLTKENLKKNLKH